jgi:predicted Zn-dependent protease with MMP-like domain
LAGRSAKLGDGYSRNPPERDELLEQRTKDLAGLVGQYRGFDLEQYLSDYCEDQPTPWTIGDDALPDPKEEVKSMSLVDLAAV